MAVAVKNTPVAAVGQPLNRFAINSWVGVAYVLGCIAVAFYGISWLAGALAPTQDAAGLFGGAQAAALWFVVRCAAIVGFAYAGLQLVGNQPPRGLSTGVCFGLLSVFIIGLVTCALGRTFESWMGAQSPAAIALTLAIGVAALGGVMYLYFVPRFERALIQVEDQGWFTVVPYKRTQGQKVRRGTILGLLILTGCGIYSLMQSNILPAGDWSIVVPFTGGRTLTLLPTAKYSVPLVLMFLSFWFAYRVVNFPVFADFLIATEAELNKVSWTTRKRLIQDTIVVLVTVVLLTLFLFFVDQIWAWILTKIGVIQPPPPSSGPGGSTVPY